MQIILTTNQLQLLKESKNNFPTDDFDFDEQILNHFKDMQSRGYVYIDAEKIKTYRLGKPNKCEQNSFDYAKKSNVGYESFESFANLEQNRTLFRWSSEQQHSDYYNKWLEKYGTTIAYGYCFYYEPNSNSHQTVWHYINCKGNEYIETTPIKYPIGYLMKNIPIEEVLKARDWGDLRTGKLGTD